MSRHDDDTRNHRMFSFMGPLALYRDVEADAAALGISVSAAARLRLQSGTVMSGAQTALNDVKRIKQ
jgi:hypothetical protein